ncbi:hypothetical protein F5Y14DRAFT_130204 [Nemania sp. NC0429]|nr:hypothetical protein F5Y14DRAFT_130204 [Nemania sp. NC0429]
MRLSGVVLGAIISSAAAALHQRVVVHSPGAVEITTQNSDISNITGTMTKAPPPLKTDVADKPAVEASIMGLIVFSAAGLVLL